MPFLTARSITDSGDHALLVRGDAGSLNLVVPSFYSVPEAHAGAQGTYAIKHGLKAMPSALLLAIVMEYPKEQQKNLLTEVQKVMDCPRHQHCASILPGQDFAVYLYDYVEAALASAVVTITTDMVDRLLVPVAAIMRENAKE